MQPFRRVDWLHQQAHESRLTEQLEPHLPRFHSPILLGCLKQRRAQLDAQGRVDQF